MARAIGLHAVFSEPLDAVPRTHRARRRPLLRRALAVVAVTLALIGQQRIKSLEQELVRRQQDSQGQAIEARALAQQAQDLARSAESKVALLDSRVAETALQRTQLEDLIQQMSRSRDENLCQRKRSCKKGSASDEAVE